MNEFLAVCSHWTFFFCLGGTEWVLGSIWDFFFKNLGVQRRGAAKETEQKRVEAGAGQAMTISSLPTETSGRSIPHLHLGIWAHVWWWLQAGTGYSRGCRGLTRKSYHHSRIAGPHSRHSSKTQMNAKCLPAIEVQGDAEDGSAQRREEILCVKASGLRGAAELNATQKEEGRGPGLNTRKG